MPISNASISILVVYSYKSKPLERECQFRVLTVKAWRYQQRATPDYLAASVEEKIKLQKGIQSNQRGFVP